MASRRMLFVLCVLALLISLPAVADSAKGSFTANGKKVNLKYAYATSIKNPFDKKKTDTLVVVTDKDIPPGALFDEFALMSLVDKGITGFTVEIDADKRVNSGTLFSPAFKKMHQFSSVGKQEINLTAMTKDRIAGTVSMPADDFFDEKYQFTATFDVPVQTKAAQKPVALKGTPLPADGGEPGKAWQAYRKAIQSGDMAAIRKSVTKDMAKQTEDPDFKKMLGVIQAMSPKKVKIKSGSVDGDTATLLVDNLDEKNATGTITLVRESGQWKLQKEDWKTRSE
ncbi:MAG TPA: hypothetical protein VLV78_01625 [Thermoanaerobaculia bacterium]|nr:hypothetical protein [Thermoanaerobaculia bacterium]